MARQIPADRFARLIDVATTVFIRQGYVRTQMADVAEALGVAKGTVYLYVESKEALFDLVVRHADSTVTIEAPTHLPVPTPVAGATQDEASRMLGRRGRLPLLEAALGRSRVVDVAAEFEAIVREIYATLSANRTAIKLIDRCAPDFPQLAELWFKGGREGLMALLSRYLESRIGRNKLARLPDIEVAARAIIEMAAFWAVHRHWDPHPQAIDEDVAEETLVRFVLGALVAPQRG